MADEMSRWSKLTMPQRAELIRLAVNSGITNLDDIKNIYEDGGILSSISNLVSKAVSKAKSLGTYALNYTKHNLGESSEDFIDLSNKKVARIDSNTSDVETILTNDFTEHNNNGVRQKKDFVNTTDTLIGDRGIPLSRISTYYGIEDGKLKAGYLDEFKDETVVVPNRAQNIGKIKKILPPSELALREQEIKDSIAGEYNKKMGYEAPLYAKAINAVLPFTKPMSQTEILARNEPYRMMGLMKDTFGNKEYRAITESNDTVPLPHLNGPKILFSNENGNSAFVSNFRNKENTDRLNQFLLENPSYPIMVDNGRYAMHLTKADNPDVYDYSGFGDPDKMFILGTVFDSNNQHRNNIKALGGQTDEDTIEKTTTMPELVVTPSGSYPHLKDFLNFKAKDARIAAANNMLNLKEPLNPVLPSNSLMSKLDAHINNLSDEERIAKYGINENAANCIFNATSMYGDKDAVVTGNKTFRNNPNKYGFVKIPTRRANIGDIVQYRGITDGITDPIYNSVSHATMVTGFNKNKPLLSYSKGSPEPYSVNPDGTKSSNIVHNNPDFDYLFGRLFGSSIPDAIPSVFRYVGTPSKRKEWVQDYNTTYKRNVRLKE